MMQFLGEQSQREKIESFEPVFLQPHGGDLGGFVLVKGERTNLDTMVASTEFQRITTRAQISVEHVGVVNCILGQELEKQMGTFLPDTADLR